MKPKPPTTQATPQAPQAHEHGNYVDAAAALLGLPIAPEHRAGVVMYFGIATAMARLVMECPLALDDEPAALFVPVAAEQA